MAVVPKKKKIKVAICSRDSEENYNWLKEFLEKRMCKRTRIKISPVYITNDTSKFRQDISKYDFAILYHTKKRGRINITNVTDSLYDEELTILYHKFRRKKVAVVVDDLENSADTEKGRILAGQEDLRKHARDVFLFTQADKSCTEQQLKKIKDEAVQEKLKKLKACIKGKDRGMSLH